MTFGPFGGGFDFAFAPFMLLGMVLQWGLIVAIVVLGIRYFTGLSLKPFGVQAPDALEIARERFAKGEITAEELETIKSVLRK